MAAVEMRTSAFLFLVFAAGCTAVEVPPSVAAVEPAPAVAEPVAPIAVAPVEPVIAESKPAETVPVPATPVPLPAAPEVKRAAPAPVKAKAAEKVAAAPLAVEQPAVEQPPKVAAPVAPVKALEPSLDLAGLTARLRDTKAVGVMTKLALKNQVDDLLKKFRAHYQGGQAGNVATLRPSYDMLVMKVLAVVQDGDPALAKSVAGSREAIWAILADREKFSLIA